MRSGSGFQGLIAQLESDGASIQSHECSRISYSRGFLLSVCGTERCRYLPKDFDSSMLHEFEDASTGLLEFPINLDSGRSGSLSRGLLRNLPNDGLLGSGRCIATASSLKVQCSNDSNALKKSEKPYRPPHFYKVMPHSGRGSIDSFSEDTSGSDTSCGERDKEERRRKDSFHVTRNDQHTKTSDAPKAEDCGVPPASYGNSTKGLVSTPVLSSRQPTEESVSTSLEETSGTKSPTISSLTEVANAEKCSGSSDPLHKTTNGDSEESYQCCEPNLIQEVYTYLQQSVLSEANENNPTEASNDHDASSHLLTWLQCGIDQKDLKLSSERINASSDELHLKLEQSVLSAEVNENHPTEHEQYKSPDDHDASSHLLTWLQCGIDHEDPKLSSEQSNASSESDEHHLKLEGDEKSRNVTGKRSKSRFESSLPHNLIHGMGSTEEEIHLPDEDSLFTFDYSTAPQDSDSSAQADLARKLSALGLGMKTYNVHSQQCHPQFNHSQVNPQTACYNPPYAWYPGNAVPYPYQQPCAWPGSFVSPPPFSHPQFGQATYQWQAYPQVYQQTGYGGHGVLPNPGYGGHNIQVQVNQLCMNQNQNQNQKQVKNFNLRGKR